MERMPAAGSPSDKIARRVEKALHVHRQMREDPSRRWKVITLVREPVARRVSCFFHHLASRLPDIDLGQDLRPGDYPRIQDAIVESADPYFRNPEDWFAEELASVFGLDVFSRDFPHATGYMVVEGRRADLLVVRVEDLDRCGAAAVREFLAPTDFRLVPANRASDKPYALQYGPYSTGSSCKTRPFRRRSWRPLTPPAMPNISTRPRNAPRTRNVGPGRP
jgi:hypothetical protein